MIAAKTSEAAIATVVVNLRVTVCCCCCMFGPVVVVARGPDVVVAAATVSKDRRQDEGVGCRVTLLTDQSTAPKFKYERKTKIMAQARKRRNNARERGCFEAV